MNKLSQEEIDRDFQTKVLDEYFKLATRWIDQLRIFTIVCFSVGFMSFLFSWPETSCSFCLAGLCFCGRSFQRQCEFERYYNPYRASKLSGYLTNPQAKQIFYRTEERDGELFKLARVIICDQEQMSFAKPLSFSLMFYLWGKFIKIPF